MPICTRRGRKLQFVLAALMLAALNLTAALPLAPIASARIAPEALSRIGRATLIAPVAGAKQVESEARFVFETPRGWTHPQILVSRAPFDPSQWTKIESVDGMVVRDVKDGTITLAELKLGIDAETPLYWAIAVENPGTHQVRVSDVRSFVAERKFVNRVAPAPWQPVTRKGTLSATELAATQWEHGLAKGEAPHIRLVAGYDFQPSKAAPTVPAELSARAVRLEGGVDGGNAMRSHLVQFAGTPSANERAAIAKAGGVVFSYIPDQAFLVRMTDEARTRLANEAKPMWVGDYQPAFKLSPQADRNATDARSYTVLLFQDADVAASRQAIEALGLHVTTQSDNGINKMLRFDAAGASLAQVAALNGVAWVEPTPKLVMDNYQSQWVVQTNAAQGRRAWQLGLRGQNQVVMTSDSGIRTTHNCFVDAGVPITAFGDFPTHRKIIAYKMGSDDPGVLFGDQASASYHGTHTAGTFVGNDDGIAADSIDGMAKEAKIFFMDCSGPALGNTISTFADLNDLFLPSYVGNGGGAARVSSNSWGAAVAGAYNLNSLNVDQFMWNHPDYYIAFSTGNSGTVGSVGAPATAKNCTGSGGTANGTSTAIYASTSRGPTADGRRKPTFATPGQSLVSALGSSNTGRQTLSGTSMSCPSGSGAVTLMRQYLTEGWYPTGAAVPANGFTPSAALLKAMAVNGGSSNVTGTVAPDNNVGWGKLAVDSVLYFAGDVRKLLLVDNTDGLGQGQFIEYQINVVDNTMPLEVSLVWTDYPGNPVSAIQLVNNLDLTVSQGATVYKGNVYGGTQFSQTGGVYDDRNVEEGVRVQNPALGVWTVRIAAPAVPIGPQPFALVFTGGIGQTAGMLALDRAEYGSTSTVELQVIDTNAGGSVNVNVSSTTETTPTVVTLNGSNGILSGTINLTTADVNNGDGLLSVSHGDVITATYQDASPVASLTANATVSFKTPTITNVAAASVGGGSEQVSWTTDINATSKVYYGATPALELGSATVAGSPITHAVVINGLTPGQTYYYDVESVSLNGNSSRDDKGGSHYTFTAKVSGDVLMVFGETGFTNGIAWKNALSADGYDYDLWEGSLADNPALGDLNSGLRSYRAVLWQPGQEEYPAFTDVALPVITNYLDGGGRLLVTGHDIVWGMADPTSPSYSAARQTWVNNTLRTFLAEDPVTYTQNIGVVADPISGAYTGGVAYTPIRDGGACDEITINQAAGGTGVVDWINNESTPGNVGFRWESATPNGSGATALWGGLPSRLATMYYEFTQVTPPATSPSAIRNDILDKTIVWLLGRERPTVAITAPNGAEVITTSSTNITWNETVGSGRVIASRTLDYSVDGGQSWTLIASGVGPSPYNWNLASVPNSANVLVRIRNVDDGSPTLRALDQSNAVFTLSRSGGDLQGPVVVAGTIASAPNPIVRPNPATLTARVTDASTGSGTVSAAEWSFGNSPAPAGSGTAMTGSFGTTTVDVSAALNTTPFNIGAQKLWVRAQDNSGNWGPASALSLQINGPPPTGVDETPTVAFLRPNMPNPFGAQTAFRFGLPNAGHVTLGIYDVQGRMVRLLIDRTMPAGTHSTSWDRKDDQGLRVKAGVYYYRLQTPSARFEKRLVALD